MFIQIPTETLKQVYGEHPKTTLYFSGNPVVRGIFWSRLKTLYALLSQADHSSHHVVDFGGGNGIFIPTLSQLFNRVTCLDLDTVRAAKIAAQFHLKNVTLRTADLNHVTRLDAPADVVIAADVLEHFQDLSRPVRSISGLLKNHGELYTSQPTENRLYVFLRTLTNQKKPEDHYHTGHEVEQFLARHGFRLVRRKYIPSSLFPLFIISRWSKTGPGV
jgi:2-polyprenyl-3-methyl-5-hydroxy-6-metoxy-1,4-benzoquinol methylase